VVPQSNLEGSAPLPVGTPRGISLHGISDLAGNVREWTQNLAGTSGSRFILGGGWSDPGYAFVDAYAQPPLDRSAINGIRLARYLPGDVARRRVTALRAPSPITSARRR
jgi:formylglycine-generating enzyme required for sulfatase activity